MARNSADIDTLRALAIAGFSAVHRRPELGIPNEEVVAGPGECRSGDLARGECGWV